MSADDTTRAGRREVGEALVAALGFEPTSNTAAGGSDSSLAEAADAALERLAATQTVSVEDREFGHQAGGPGSDAADGRAAPGSGGNGSRSNGAAAEPGNRRNPRGARGGRNGASGSSSSSSSSAGAGNRSGGPSRGPGTRGGGGKSSAGSSRAVSTAADAAARAREERATAANRVAALDGSEPGSAGFTPPGPLVTAPVPKSPPPPPGPPEPAGGPADYDATPGWTGHILPEDQTLTAMPESPPMAPPQAAPPSMAPPSTAGDGGGAGFPLVNRSNLNTGAAKGLAGDLAAKVPQLVGEGLRSRSRVRARKVRRVVRHIDPWSVLTFSVLFHLCVFAALLLSSVLVWNAADAAGTIENIENFIRELGDYQTYEIKGDVVFRAAMIIAGILTLASSVMVVLLTVVFNLISDLVGGIRVTVVEEETVKVHRNRNQ